MHPIDILFITILVGFTLWGLWFGLLHSLGSLVGTAVGALLAAKFYGRFAESMWGKVISFIALFVISSKLVGLIFYLIERAFKLATIIPGLKTVNRVLGAALGFVEGAVVLGVSLYFLNMVPVGTVGGYIRDSAVAPTLMQIGGTLVQLFPSVVEELRGIVAPQ